MDRREWKEAEEERMCERRRELRKEEECEEGRQKKIEKMHQVDNVIFIINGHGEPWLFKVYKVSYLTSYFSDFIFRFSSCFL